MFTPIVQQILKHTVVSIFYFANFRMSHVIYVGLGFNSHRSSYKSWIVSNVRPIVSGRHSRNQPTPPPPENSLFTKVTSTTVCVAFETENNSKCLTKFTFFAKKLLNQLNAALGAPVLVLK